jgi:hypothetical protein
MTTLPCACGHIWGWHAESECIACGCMTYQSSHEEES